MVITYFKRYRMEVDLHAVEPPELPAPFAWTAWEEELIDAHAEVKHRCFQGTIDAQVFPSLSEAAGCRRLMSEIRRKPGFLPGACWLIEGPDGYVATIQGVIDRAGKAAIQNVGVVPEWRGCGFGRLIVAKALEGFRAAGQANAYLEVTVENERAVRLYRSMGFRRIKTLYKIVDL